MLDDKIDVILGIIEGLQQQITKLETRTDLMTVTMHNENADAIEAITPYMESKKAYIGDTSCIFNNVREGNVTAYMVTDSGLTMPTTIERSGSTVTVSFEALEEVATVTISVL